MNYYIDTEFIEDFTSPVLMIPAFKWRKPKHYIDLISIGIVAEDGREYFAVSNEFDLKYVWNKYDIKPKGIGTYEMLTLKSKPVEKVYWLRENVLKPLHIFLCSKMSTYEKTHHYNTYEPFTYNSLKNLIRWYGKSNKEISTDIVNFTTHKQKSGTGILENIDKVRELPVFYGYYADYDWVLFCSLFGRMIDLPKGYPMYCRDLKQIMDNLELDSTWKDRYVPGDNEHHALADAHWNRKLHKVLQQFPAFLVNQ